MIRLSKIIEYIPKFMGEHERWKAGKNTKPLIFHINVMGAIDQREHLAKLREMVKNIPGATFRDKLMACVEEGGGEVQKVITEEVKKRIVKIEGLEIDGKAIKTGEEFYECPAIPPELVAELENNLLDMNAVTSDEAKN